MDWNPVNAEVIMHTIFVLISAAFSCCRWDCCQHNQTTMLSLRFLFIWANFLK